MKNISFWIIRSLAIAMSVFHLYAAYAGTFHPFFQRSIHLAFASVLIFLTKRATKKSSSVSKIPVCDWVLALLSLPVFGYVAANAIYLSERWPMTPSYALTPLQITLALLSIVILFEATRRVMGWPLLVFASGMLLFSYFGKYLTGPVLSHSGFSVTHILDFMYLTMDGIWGVALGVSATYIALFIVFGAFIEKSGAANFFIDFAKSIAGQARGGPAKVAIFASALTGSVTGSTVANVYTTGTFTIPMMKKLGYKPHFAGAVEALASNGGQIMPPILGAAAFLMSAYTGVPYVKIAIASIFPAFLYFGGLLCFIHFEACKLGLAGLPEEEKLSVVSVMLKGGHMLSPLLFLIVILMYGVSPIRAAFYSILFTVVVSWVRKETRMSFRDVLDALEKGGKNIIMIAMTCGIIGYIIGGFTLTGVGLNVSSGIISLSGGVFFFSLVLTGLACIILGMGMPTIAAYILVSVIAVPTLTNQGVNVLVANIFVFYFALLSHITPPVCIAVYAAAQIAEANTWKTAVTAVKMGVVAYLLPFLVVYTPSLLLVGSTSEMFTEIPLTFLGLILLVSAIQGWLFCRENYFERALAVVASIGLLYPTGFGIKLISLVFMLLTVASNLNRSKKEKLNLTFSTK